jgi:hypothetical protein
MPITQILLTANTGGGGGGGGGGGDAVGTYTWDAAPTSYTRPNGGNDPALQSVLMPDGLTTKNIHVFNGSNYISTAGNAAPEFFFNIWFYPTANNIALMSEQGSPVENTVFYYNMLEINSFNRINAGVWNGESISTITFSDTVNLNAWNHLFFYYGSGTLGIELNGGTRATTTAARDRPTTSYFTVGSNLLTAMTTSNRFRGSLGDVDITSSPSGSNFLGTKAVYGL